MVTKAECIDCDPCERCAHWYDPPNRNSTMHEDNAAAWLANTVYQYPIVNVYHNAGNTVEYAFLGRRFRVVVTEVE